MFISGQSKGNQSKEWINSGKELVKYDSPNWYESIAEVLSAELQYYIKEYKPFVDYSWVEYKGCSACICKNFLHSGEMVISLYKVLQGYNILDLAGLELKNALCGLVKMELGLDIEEYLSYMVYLDAILLNEDRHLRNISIITSKEGYKLTPYYDFGLSLLSDKNEYTEIEDIYKVSAQPFSQDFFKQIALFENPKIQIDVKQLFLKLKDAKIYSNRYITIYSKAKDLERAISVLEKRLLETEGILWTAL